MEKELHEIGKDLEHIFEKPSSHENNDSLKTAEDSKRESSEDSKAEVPYIAPSLLKEADKEDALSGDELDADLLDIPAFLRRQAN